jgi:hypothetical protein
MKRTTFIAAAALLLGVATAGQAQAESAPGCGPVTQIGKTAYVGDHGQKWASVKQFKGCGKNFSYIYVWDSWIARAGRGFILRTHIYTRDNNTHGYKTGARGQRELWGGPADTVERCTRAHGEVDGSSYIVFAKTGERC